MYYRFDWLIHVYVCAFFMDAFNVCHVQLFFCVLTNIYKGNRVSLKWCACRIKLIEMKHKSLRIDFIASSVIFKAIISSLFLGNINYNIIFIYVGSHFNWIPWFISINWNRIQFQYFFRQKQCLHWLNFTTVLEIDMY